MDISDRDFDNLRRFVRKLCGLQVPDEKRYLITHRLAPLRRALGCSTWSEFHDFLAGKASDSLRDQVVTAMTTNETSFFRDKLPFEAFKEHLLPEFGRLVGRGGAGKGGPVRIWCAASSTGQEPYTMAMFIHDYVRVRRGQGVSARDFRILATDISTRVLEQAVQGRYSALEMRRGLPEYYRRYFQKNGEHWALDEEIRSMVEFKRINLVEPFSGLGRFNFILCRNVLIYFQDEARHAIMDQFYGMLPPGGYLLLGASEGLYGLAKRFESVQVGKSLFYRKPMSAA